MNKWLLPVGFLLVIVFVLSVAAVIVERMDTINADVDKIVNQHNVKVGHIMTMYTSARERSVSMLKMMTMEDPFEREEEYDYFNSLATRFAVARLALLDMKMSVDERRLIDEHGDLVRIALGHQNVVIDLLAGDDFDAAEQVLLSEAIPTQNNVLDKLTEIVDYHTKAAKQTLASARNHSRESVIFISLLALTAVVLCIGIAWYVVRSLKTHQDELREYNIRLEQRVHERTAELEDAYQELKNSQTQLVHSEKMASLGQMTAGIAHEIKNPLNFINNFSETSRELIDDLDSSLQEVRSQLSAEQIEYIDGLIDDLQSDLGKIENHGKRADGIVRSMLMHARESGSHRESTNINQLVEENLNLAFHSERARSKGFNIELISQYADNVGELNIEPQEVSRVLLNLFSNAFHATEERRARDTEAHYAPKLIVRTARDTDQVRIEITDNGAGMPDDVCRKIFEPFFTTKATGEGTGLGLSMSYDIIRQSYGGNLEVDSTVGQGSCFLITLPTESASVDDAGAR